MDKNRKALNALAFPSVDYFLIISTFFPHRRCRAVWTGCG
ncbi:Uncharacterized protein ChrSV_3730 [Chromobacterium vaccinii]|nr:Uncharacterized protein ChrSW_3730 [Chromobacterium vaccinii]QND91187.1 Uncharacterized protein ChrSV_3730 [Chromobacterium vaccinii]